MGTLHWINAYPHLCKKKQKEKWEDNEASDAEDDFLHDPHDADAEAEHAAVVVEALGAALALGAVVRSFRAPHEASYAVDATHALRVLHVGANAIGRDA